MPTTDLEVLRRLCRDPLLCEHEAEAGVVLAEPKAGGEGNTARRRRTLLFLLGHHGPQTAVELSLRTRVKEKILRRILRHAWFASESFADSPTVFGLSAAGEAALDSDPANPPAVGAVEAHSRRVETIVAVERAIAAVRTDRHSTWARLAEMAGLPLPDGDSGAEDVL
jgi:hypothetical protein